MDQQFEHLNGAQVEHYGEPDFGAGTDQEGAPDWDLKDGDPKIAAHLDKCPSCRTRVLASMRSRLALSTDKPVITAARPDCPSEDDLRNLAAGLCPPEMGPTLTDHAATCDHCGPILRMYTEDFAEDFGSEDQDLLRKLQSGSASWQKELAKRIANLQKSDPEKNPSKK